MEIEDFIAAVDDHIDRVGWHAQGVYPTIESEENTPCFMYTAGLSEKGYHDYIVFGLNPGQGHVILENIVDKTIRNKQTPSGLVEGVVIDYVVCVKEVDPEQWQNYFGVAMGRANRKAAEFNASIIYWPDEEGRFPWNKGYEYESWTQPDIAIYE